MANVISTYWSLGNTPPGAATVPSYSEAPQVASAAASQRFPETVLSVPPVNTPSLIVTKFPLSDSGFSTVEKL